MPDCEIEEFFENRMECPYCSEDFSKWAGCSEKMIRIHCLHYHYMEYFNGTATAPVVVQPEKRKMQDDAPPSPQKKRVKLEPILHGQYKEKPILNVFVFLCPVSAGFLC